MSELLNSLDCKVLINVNELKNAVFYKDLLAFYDAYKSLTESSANELPNFVYHSEKFSLEGICLFMKDYSAELGFETLNLSLNYLRILYYAMASYSDNKMLPDREKISDEFEEYKKLISKKLSELGSEKNEYEQRYFYSIQNYNKKSKANLKNKTLQHTFNFLSLFFLLLGIFCVIAPFTFYFLNSMQLLFASLASLGCIAVGLTLFFVFRKLSKKYNATENGTVYEMNASKRDKISQDVSLKKLLSNYSLIATENYECLNSLSDVLFKDARLSFNNILCRAKEYKLLSYNIKRDVLLIFTNQQKDIDSIKSQLKSVEKSSDASKMLGEIYKEICQKDWLKYNSDVRCAFLAKFIEIAEKTYNYELNGQKSGETPFGINIKRIAKETIAFLKSRESLFVSSSVDKFMTSNYLKNQNIFRLKKDIDAEDYLNLKMAYTTKFYDYEKLKSYNNIFYDKKIGKGAKVPEQIIEKYAKLPTLIFLKLRLKESELKLENSDTENIKRTSEVLFSSDKEYFVTHSNNAEEVIEIAEENITKAIYECDEVIEDASVTKYRFGTTIINGYKIS